MEDVEQEGAIGKIKLELSNRKLELVRTLRAMVNPKDKIYFHKQFTHTLSFSIITK